VREAFVAAVNAPEMKQQFLQQGALPVTATGAEYQQLMQAESAKWKDIISKAKITLE
jgi:tripartite-type tricarboxylate transporter receptor subunit TctC